jgi:hypothetical protein
MVNEPHRGLQLPGFAEQLLIPQAFRGFKNRSITLAHHLQRIFCKSDFLKTLMNCNTHQRLSPFVSG